MQEYLIHSQFTLIITWNKDLIERTSLLPPGSGTANCKQGFSRPSRVLQALNRCYLEQKNALWLDAPLNWKKLPPFRARALKTLLWLIPWGRTVTYSGLAAMCGNPRAARAVGTAMAGNPWPVIIPCHRVIRAGTGLGGFSSGTDFKKRLLALETAPLGCCMS
ncbi:MGMT family protein [Desulfonatronospira sp.]|uniref:methylated-DNA--[protein]-cysteine S-methyltransferase n=1 Tax=Desulfonatronospira sp. TaxID=1962951 RepID=UPI0025BB3A1E|nr:MGMT family protein [Desulfonatronospira sp.]